MNFYGRKVRAPNDSIADNVRPPRGEDKCSREDVQGFEVVRGSVSRSYTEFLGTPAVVKIGKLYVVQAQIGLCLRAVSPKQAGRVLEP